MAEITRFSFYYSVPEDRLALDTLDSDGVATRLWLTQRFCRGLVPPLVDKLAEAARAAPAAARATVQSWEQAAAVADLGRVPPVQPGPEATTGLVHEVRIDPVEGRLMLTFRFGHGEARAIGVSAPALRQMLAEMYRLQAGAGWALDQWPEWIADPAAGAAGGAVN
jgi:hypothetical protein